MKKTIGYIIGATLGLVLLVVLLVAGCATWLYCSADMRQPVVAVDTVSFRMEEKEGYRQYGDNYLRRSAAGFWELSVRGNAMERGVAAGRLMPELLYYQEKVFVDQIRELIPSDSYLRFLRFLLVMFNRHLADYIPEEYREEIYGISLSCTHEFDAIGTPYERQLNYHAAHDIGHAMQDYMLVGCSSFGVWGTGSADSSLLIGRNFDFYVGDAFAHNKQISIYRPDSGYRFVSVGWPGMTGVLSGMNEAGLTVTINAAKSTVPASAAMPISLLAREILQYASTIDEAYAIAGRRQTFVSESLLIGSARDGKAAIIEKSPDRIALVLPHSDRIVCTNHYQSEAFSHDERNLDNIATSDSPYRYARLEELIAARNPLTPPEAAAILRDYRGKDGKDIGLCNEKALNQFLAHHSVIFQPERRLMWVSASPWQLGEYVCYDLNTVFDHPDFSHEIARTDLNIPADTLLQTPVYTRVLRYKEQTRLIRQSISSGHPLDDSLLQEYVSINPELYYVHQLLGDYYAAFGSPARALACRQTALTKEIPHSEEREALMKKIEHP